MDGDHNGGVSAEQEMADGVFVAASTAMAITDYKISRAVERYFAGAEWCDWRDMMRDAKKHPLKYPLPLPPEPPFGAPAMGFVTPTAPEEQCQPIPPAQLAAEELEALRKENAALKARVEELENEPPPLLPDLATPMLEHDASFRPLRDLMNDGETLYDAKRRLFPILTEERQSLKNREALENITIPRRVEIERLLGMLARVGDTK